MKRFLLAGILLFAFRAYSQHSLHIILTDASPKKADNVFIAGDFNNWNPGDQHYQLKRSGRDQWEIQLTGLSTGEHNYKFTEGNWENAEANATGKAAGNRAVQIDQDAERMDTVPAWTDGKPAVRIHSASARVRIINTAFYMSSLNRTRRIWIYLPEGYDPTDSIMKYPVLYMHDGQNLFDDVTSGFGEWGVDEALDSLQKQTGKYCIVVGIDHGGEKRMTEYDPYDNQKFGKEEGIEYVDFLANELKPFIDQHYRTMPVASGTAIAGSSMGGLISAYAVLKYPHTFGAAGIFSPSFWIAPEMKQLADGPVMNLQLRFWFYAGEKESESMVSDMKTIRDIVAAKYKTDIAFSTDPMANHNETAWRKWFPEFYKWWVAGL